MSEVSQYLDDLKKSADYSREANQKTIEGHLDATDRMIAQQAALKVQEVARTPGFTP